MNNGCSVSTKASTMTVPGVLLPQDSPLDSASYSRLLQRIYGLSSEAGRLTPMEGLRGLAVLLVFFVHFDALFGNYARHATMLWRPTRFLGIVGNGGVDLFFVLSGYLIYGALIRHSANVLRFLRRRVERIYPTFLAVFGLYLVLSFMFPQASKLQGRTWTEASVYIVQNLLLLPGIFHIPPMITLAWSLSYEFFFYISVALLIRAARMWAWKRSLRAVFFAGLWWVYLAYCFSVSKSHVRALMFVVGILLYEALSHEKFRRMLSRRGEIVAIVLLLGSLAFAYLIEVQRDAFSFLPGLLAGGDVSAGVPSYQGPYKTIALSISMFWLTTYCFAFDGRLKRLFSWTPLRYLGNMSYSYYLIHGVTLQGVAMVWMFLASRGAPQMPLFVAGLFIGFAVTWVSSTVLFLIIEKPFSLQRNAAETAPAAGRAYHA